MNGKKTNSIIIRSARSEDIVEVAKKIKELARFEKMEHIVKVTVDQLLKDGGFLSKNDPKLYELLIAETENDRKLIGYAMWSYTYSSCEGKIAHLQDLLIDEKFRRQGIAKQFFSLISKEVIEQNGAYLKLNVLGWNKYAKQFYSNLGGKNLTEDEDYHIYRFDHKALEKLAKSIK